MLLLTSDCSGHLVTARASDSMFCIDFVRVTSCFYDYDSTVRKHSHFQTSLENQSIQTHLVLLCCTSASVSSDLKALCKSVIIYYYYYLFATFWFAEKEPKSLPQDTFQQLKIVIATGARPRTPLWSLYRSPCPHLDLRGPLAAEKEGIMERTGQSREGGREWSGAMGEERGREE